MEDLKKNVKLLETNVQKLEEKLDDNNGFLLCPNHDKLFDRGLISFHDSGQIIISSEIRKEDRALLRIDNNVSIKIFEKQKVYLNYHRKHIFQK